MKNLLSHDASLFFSTFVPAIAAAVLVGGSVAHAGLDFELDLMAQSQGQSYYFVTPLLTNAALPAAPLGTYFISSPQWPTNGCSGRFELTASGMSSGNYSPFGYRDLASVVEQITSGYWTLLFTNATTTNVYKFYVGVTSISTNLFPGTIITFPAAGSVILPGQTNFTWQGPTNWPVMPYAQVWNNSYSRGINVPAGRNHWNVDASFPAGMNYSFYLFYQTNCDIPIFIASPPASTNSAPPISGWASHTVLENSATVNFTVVPAYGTPEHGHTCLADYTFEDNNLFVHDFSGNGNNMSYSWFGAAPYIVTGDAVAGIYAGGFGGSGWFTPPDSLRSLFAGSFSVSLWLKTTNTHGFNSDDQNNAAGIVSDLNGDESRAAMPMGQTGGKLAFYTGGSLQNTLHSQADINTGQYVHVVTTRDQQTGEKRIFVNGVLDSSVHAATDLLTGSTSGGLTIGFNKYNVFVGKMDEIQFYSGVLSSNEVAFLHSHPGTNVADTLEVSHPLARYDFEQTNAPETDSSGHHYDANCGSGNGGPNLDTFTTNAAVGSYARQFFGDTSICFWSGAPYCSNLWNALGGSFTVSAWIKTTNTVSSIYDNAFYGSPILFAYSSNTNWVSPLAITGGAAAFTISDPSGTDTTLHSTTLVNDGNYHLLAATRNQTNGEINLYVDGVLNGTMTGTTNRIFATSYIYLAGGYFTNYVGLMDDVRIYGGILNADDIAILYGQPSFNNALNTAGMTWSSSGDTQWFTETTNTYLGATAAAQSGSVTNNQVSTLEVTVTGPGTLTFYWSCIAEDPNQNFDYKFYVDDPDGGGMAGLYGDNDWSQAGPFTIPAGQHTLGWTVCAWGDTDPTQAGFLDQVSYVASSPVNLLNPQTVGTNFQFSFMPQAGLNYDIEYRANLVSGSWQTYTNVTGDGTLKIISLPFSLFSPSKQGFIRVSTQ